MRFPSTATLERAFPGKGKALRKLLTDNDTVNAHPAVLALVAQCYTCPTMSHKRMTAIDAELETFGVVHVQGNGTARTPSFEYCNAGDTYATTIIRVCEHDSMFIQRYEYRRDNGQYRVSNWGDMVERGSYE